jgi:hypothetical protein
MPFFAVRTATVIDLMEAAAALGVAMDAGVEWDETGPLETPERQFQRRRRYWYPRA